VVTGQHAGRYATRSDHMAVSQIPRNFGLELVGGIAVAIRQHNLVPWEQPCAAASGQFQMPVLAELVDSGEDQVSRTRRTLWQQ
jgi:hypothetical protein